MCLLYSTPQNKSHACWLTKILYKTFYIRKTKLKQKSELVSFFSALNGKYACNLSSKKNFSDEPSLENIMIQLLSYTKC